MCNDLKYTLNIKCDYIKLLIFFSEMIFKKKKHIQHILRVLGQV